jgi:CcmD family protein
MSDPSLKYLGAGFGVTWLIMAAYLIRLARAQRDIARRLEDKDRDRPESGSGELG